MYTFPIIVTRIFYTAENSVHKSLTCYFTCKVPKSQEKLLNPSEKRQKLPEDNYFFHGGKWKLPETSKFMSKNVYRAKDKELLLCLR